MSLFLLFSGAGTAPGAYTIPVDSGVYTLSGQTASLRHSDLIGAGAGSYAISGVAVSLLLGAKAVASAGAYTLTGTAATLKTTRIISGAASSYALTGATVSLKHGYLLSTAVGDYTVLGSTADFSHLYVLSASAGSYLITGTIVDLNRAGYLSAASNSYSITGSLVSTLYQRYIIHPFTGTDLIGAHEYFPWHNKDGLTVYYNKSGHGRKRYFPTDLERQDVLVRKTLAIPTPTTTQELDWDVNNSFDVTLNTDVTFTFSNPRDDSDFVILLTKDANATVRNITWPASLAWSLPGQEFTSLTASGETKLVRVSYFGNRYRAALY